jgi:hypothetical protein
MSGPLALPRTQLFFPTKSENGAAKDLAQSATPLQRQGFPVIGNVMAGTVRAFGTSRRGLIGVN